MKNIIFCDIDGTIIDGSRKMYNLSDKTKYAVKELMKDNYFVIASGRCKGLLDSKITDLNPSGYVLCNGAYTELSGIAIYEDHISKDVIKKVKEVTDKYDGFCILETLNEFYINDTSSEAFRLFSQGWGSALNQFKCDEFKDTDYYIGMIGFKSSEDCINVFEELKDYVEIIKHNFSDSFDINSLGINKGVGVRKLIEYLNIPLENTYCFGDGLNDLGMLQEVGHPVIMANSEASLKRFGFEETDDVLDDGFYNYLVANKLIKEL